MSQVITENRITRLLKRLKIFDQWEVAKRAYRQGWEIDKRNFIFDSPQQPWALLPVYLLKVTEQVVDTITINIGAGSL